EKKALECLKALEDENIKAKIVAKAVAKQDDRFIFS
ncbi:selenide, water dikinase SelD, partial [Campylobacter coli]